MGSCTEDEAVKAAPALPGESGSIDFTRRFSYKRWKPGDSGAPAYLCHPVPFPSGPSGRAGTSSASGRAMVLAGKVEHKSRQAARPLKCIGKPDGGCGSQADKQRGPP